MLIQTEALSKHYGSLAALEDCTLAVPRGEIVGLLGPNGAGKTTLLRVLMGYLKPTHGRAEIDGLDCHRQSVEVHRRLSYLPGDARLFRRLTGRQTLQFFSRLHGRGSFKRSLALAERLQLNLGRRVGQMSTGMRQKLALVIALAPDVPLAVLDEPTANLDPTVRTEVVQLVREARDAGRAVLFSSHILSEVEQSCDRVVVLRDGRIVDDVFMADVVRQHRIVARPTAPLNGPPSELAASLRVEHRPNGTVVIRTPGDLAPLLGWLAGQSLAELRIEPLGLGALYELHHRAGAT